MRDVNKYIQEVREYESGWREFELTNGFVLSVAPTVREEVAMFMIATASSQTFADRYKATLHQHVRNSLDKIVAIRPQYHGEVPVPFSFREATTTEDEFGMIREQADERLGWLKRWSAVELRDDEG